MKILTDSTHHPCLHESIQILFGDRFGFEVYAPVGMEWFDQGYYNHERAWHGDKVAHKFLDWQVGDADTVDYWERRDTHHPRRMIGLLTLDQARAMRPDIVLCSLQHNEEGMRRFAYEVDAKFAVQIGNAGTTNRFDLADFALVSCKIPPPPCPHVFYRQEFSLRDYHPPIESELGKNLSGCFVHYFYWHDWADLYNKIAQAVPGLQWVCYGHPEPSNPYWQAFLSPCSEVARVMRAARLVTHLKTHGDGYGHDAHHIGACAKPAIVTGTYYQDQTAGPLFVDGLNCIDVQKHTLDEVIAYARRIALDDEFCAKQGAASYRLFRENVDFDRDAANVKKLLEEVL